MREIANSTRRTHLLDHAHRSSTRRSAAKLLGAVASIAVAGASLPYFDSYPRLSAITFAISMGVGLWWLLQAMSLRRRVFGSLRTDGSVAKRVPTEERASETEDLT
jgi:hypothetical protein